MLGKVRLNASDPINKDFDNIQKVQNKLVRMLTKTNLVDKISTSSLLAKNQYDVCEPDELSNQDSGDMEVS